MIPLTYVFPQSMANTDAFFDSDAHIPYRMLGRSLLKKTDNPYNA